MLADWLILSRSQDVISCHFEVSSAITSLDKNLQWQFSYGDQSDNDIPDALVIDTQIQVSPASQISAITAVTKVRVLTCLFTWKLIPFAIIMKKLNS